MEPDSKAPPVDQNPNKALGGSQYGSRLMPHVVDELAKSDPCRIHATIPVSSDISHGFRDITMLDIAQSVNQFAYWLEESLGRSTSFETLTYMGVPDLRYSIVFLAAVKCGYKVSQLAIYRTLENIINENSCLSHLLETPLG